MSKPITSIWPSNSFGFTDIASPQSNTNLINGQMVLNPNTGIYPASNPPPSSGAYVMPGMVRQIQISSISNNAGINFLVQGLGCPAAQLDTNGNPLGPVNQIISETIVGPNNSTVQSVNIYKYITSITPSTAIVGSVSAGWGRQGITDPIMCDYNRIGWYATLQAQYYIGIGAVTDYTIYVSNTQAYEAKPPYYGQWEYFPTPPGIMVTPLSAISSAFVDNAQVSQVGNIPFPLTMIWANCNDNADLTLDNLLYLTFLQQGIRS